MFAIGLPLYRGLDISEGDIKAEPIISLIELKNALQKALNISNWSDNDIVNDGWKVVFRNDIFSLYKRRSKHRTLVYHFIHVSYFFY